MKKFVSLMVFLHWLSCTKVEPIKSIPFDIHKRLTISEKCDFLLYSSNEDNYFQPKFIHQIFSNQPEIKKIPSTSRANTYPQAISCDCKSISLIEENDLNAGYTLWLYNTQTRDRKPLTPNIDQDGGSSMFSPNQQLLAYLEGRKLTFYDLTKERNILIQNPEKVDFKNINWSSKGKYILLEDYAGDIWKYSTEDKSFKLIWESKNESFTKDRLITPSADNEEVFYFVSDHESEFNQIYKFSIQHGISLFVTSGADKFLLKRPISEKYFYFRVNSNGFYFVQRYENRKINTVTNNKKVIYDYYQSKNFSTIELSTSSRSPISISNVRSTPKGIVNNFTSIAATPPIVLYNRQGIHNLIYKPDRELKGWLIWIHGGPFEQISNRYNNYIVSLNKLGWGVVAINYPGSTGIGNRYEMHNTEDLLATQLYSLREDIAAIKKEFKIKKYSILAISYGSEIAYHYSKQFGGEISAIVDFSGTNLNAYPKDIPVLFIYGSNDYMLKNNNRRVLITAQGEGRGGRSLVLSREGHLVSQRTSQIKALTVINTFLIDAYSLEK